MVYVLLTSPSNGLRHFNLYLLLLGTASSNGIFCDGSSTSNSSLSRPIGSESCARPLCASNSNVSRNSIPHVSQNIFSILIELSIFPLPVTQNSLEYTIKTLEKLPTMSKNCAIVKVGSLFLFEIIKIETYNQIYLRDHWILLRIQKGIHMKSWCATNRIEFAGKILEFFILWGLTSLVVRLGMSIPLPYDPMMRTTKAIIIVSGSFWMIAFILTKGRGIPNRWFIWKYYQIRQAVTTFIWILRS